MGIRRIRGSVVIVACLLACAVLSILVGRSVASAASVSNDVVVVIPSTTTTTTTAPYRITFNANGGTGTMAVQEFRGSTTLTDNSFSRNGYTFSGWSRTAAGSVAFADGANYSTAGNVTLYAVWTINSYTVTFDANGGSGSMSAFSFTVNGRALSANTFTRANYTFAGWSRTAAGSVAFADKANYSTAGNVTLYAVWTPVEYSITFNANGGTGSMVAQKFTVVGEPLDANKFTRANYTFAGWSRTAAGAVAFADKATYSTAGNVTLYAVWTPVEYSITFNANGGTGSMVAQKFTVVGEPLDANKFTRSGYTFSGWSKSAAGSVAFADKANYSTAGNVTLYAVWTPVEYSITFNANGGTGSMVAQKFTVVGEPLDANKFTRANYTFAGWSRTAAGSVAFADKATYSTAGNVTLYAVWTPVEYSITFNANGGTGSMVAQKFTVVGEPLDANKFTRSGYTFSGWSKSAAGSVAFADKAKYSTAGNVTLYAVWTINSYTVTFDANGGSGSMSAFSFTVAGRALSANTFTRSGYTFAGWSRTAAGSVAFADKASYSTAGNVTLYAVWTINTYTVTFNANGGTGTMPPMTFTVAGRALTLNGFRRTGKTFGGWATAANSTVVAYVDGASIAKAGNVTLYAIWK